jgi:hypothetical protein
MQKWVCSEAMISRKPMASCPKCVTKITSFRPCPSYPKFTYELFPQRKGFMTFSEWTKSNADYGRKLLESGLQGARSGEEEFFNGEPMTPFLTESARHAVTAAALGASIGLLGGISGVRQRCATRAIVCGFLGAVIGFSAGAVWQGRHLGASVVSNALKNITRVRDEHWFEKNPIDYA